ncbi:FkbM family methyltransferase [Planktosalinus lacus]|uniref:Methyltransferase FkbM domain-containing protein n=1 Tax=Planktosalinus lacus TaxID=1526573 RepID=A0A8J2V945_9FLAO|nr:FkbM family methyltransferase [Planktosalinus lacus]GGD84968.1 hypothetical protein GCM10011312_06270 [Planktosalinus lacus]
MVKKILKRFFNFLGFTIIKKSTHLKLLRAKPSRKDEYSKNNLLHNFFTLLKNQNFNPEVIFDVGAHKGTWTKQCLLYFPNAQYYLFEPQLELKNDISTNIPLDKNITLFNIGIGDTESTMSFTLHSRDDGRSFSYSGTEANNLGFKQIELPVNRLDNVIEKHRLPLPDILKIDAEGFDIKVLKGAGKYLIEIEIILVEVGVMNKRVPNNVKEVVNFLDEKGFMFFDITDLNRPFENKILWLCEFVFIKKNGKLDKNYQFTTK